MRIRTSLKCKTLTPLQKQIKKESLTALGITFKSKEELWYAVNVLEPRKKSKDIFTWKYEPCSFEIGYKCSYKPDFAVELSGGDIEYHEVKGSKTLKKSGKVVAYDNGNSGADVRFRVAAKQNPIFIFRKFAVKVRVKMDCECTEVLALIGDNKL